MLVDGCSHQLMANLLICTRVKDVVFILHGGLHDFCIRVYRH